MKKFLFSEKGKRVVIGVSMIAGAIVVGLILQNNLLGSGVRWKQAVFFLLVTGTGISGILYLFLGHKGMLYGNGVLCTLSIFIALSDTWKRYFLFLFFLGIIAGPFILKYWRSCKKNPRRATRERNSAGNPKREEYQTWPELHIANMPPLACKKSNGTIYQVFFRNGVLLFYKAGSIYHDFSESNLIREETLPKLGKDDFAIPTEEVTSLRFHEVYSDNDPFDTDISIYTHRKRYFLSAITMSGGEELKKVLRENIKQSAQDERGIKTHFIPVINKNRRNLLRKLYHGICAFATVVALAWLFLDVPYQLFAWLSLLSTPMLLMLHYLFPNEVTLAEEKKYAHGRTMIIFPTMLTVIPLIFRMDVDYFFLSQGKLFLITCIATLVLTFQAFFTSEECRMRKIQLLGLAFILFVYSFSAVGLTNALLDQTPPVEKNAIVHKMHITSTRSSTSYYFDVETEDKLDYTLGVGYHIYHQTEAGDTVRVIFHQGAFDITYIEVEPAS
jgi:hypothetical protein